MQHTILLPGYRGSEDSPLMSRGVQAFNDIEGIDASVYVPANTSEPVLADQVDGLRERIASIESENVHLVAHSLSSWLVLNMLDQEPQENVQMVALISGGAGIVQGLPPEISKHIDPAFYEKNAADFASLRDRYRFVMVHGTDDQIVPIENAKALADHLGIEVHSIEHGGHLNTEAAEAGRTDQIDAALTIVSQELRALL